jgi:hypothetical protein
MRQCDAKPLVYMCCIHYVYVYAMCRLGQRAYADCAESVKGATYVCSVYYSTTLSTCACFSQRWMPTTMQLC